MHDEAGGLAQVIFVWCPLQIRYLIEGSQNMAVGSRVCELLLPRLLKAPSIISNEYGSDTLDSSPVMWASGNRTAAGAVGQGGNCPKQAAARKGNSKDGSVLDEGHRVIAAILPFGAGLKH